MACRHLVFGLTKEDIECWNGDSGALVKSIDSPVVSAVWANDFLVVSLREKGVIQIWSWRHGHLHFKCSVAEPMTSLVMSPDGCYCVGGGKSGKVYVWEIASGDLINTFKAHYKKITAMSFTTDGTYLITGSDDALVECWSFFDIFSNLDSDEFKMESSIKPFVEWNHHILAITSIFCGMGGINGRIVSSSIDMTCKIYDIPTKSLITSISFPSPINCVAMDICANSLFAAGTDSNIYKIDLQSKCLDSNSHAVSSSILSTSSKQEIDSQNKNENKKPTQILKGHTNSVTHISISKNGTSLFSCSRDGTLRIWDMWDGTCIKTLRHQKQKPYHFVNSFYDTSNFLDDLLKPKRSSSKKDLAVQPFKKHVGSNDGSKMKILRPGSILSNQRKRLRSNSPNSLNHSIFMEETDTESPEHRLNTKTKLLGDARHEIKRLRKANAELFKLCSDQILKN